MNYFGLVRSGILTLNRLSNHQRVSSLVLIRSVSSNKNFKATISSEDGNHATSPKLVETDPADIFGTLSANSPEYSVFSTTGADPDDLNDNDGEAEYQAKIADVGRPRPFDYLIKMEKLLNTGRGAKPYKGANGVKKTGAARLQEALTLLDVDMKEQCVKPQSEHFRILIHACGRVGYFEKAFILYKEFRDRGYSPNFGIYADLFNACANSPPIHQNRALLRATTLRDNLSNQYTTMPKPVYNNMIKAFGRCGDLETAFNILDEMKEQRVFLDSEVLNHLLQGCISDKEAGFRHALIVWRRLRNKKMRPNVFTYNLMLRAAKDCNAGPQEVFPDLILEAISSGKDLEKFKQKLIEAQIAKPKEETGNSGPDSKRTEEGLVLVDDKQVVALKSVPNFLAPSPNMNNIYGIGDLSTPQVRFQLLGGVKSFIQVAKADKVNLDIKTFSQMLYCIEESCEAEDFLLNQIRSLGVKTDIDFFNQLISRRARRNDLEQGRQVVELLSGEFGHSPNIMTFGVLALCCDNLKHSFDLLNQMKESGFTPNAEILSTLVYRASKRHRPKDVRLMLREFQKNRVKPTAKTIQILEDFYKEFQKQVISVERGKPENVKSRILEEVELGLPNWKDFLEFYKDWLQRTQMEMPEHPWKQYLTAKDIQLAERGRTFFRNVID